jgi:hypothetical protein
MWFSFPDGVDQINVQLQSFFVEARDADGHGCFRAPDHFAPLILDLPGFGLGKPLGDLQDLPSQDPEQASQIRQLASQIEGLKIKNDNLRASLAELQAERDDLKGKNFELEAEMSQLKEAETKK